MRGFDKVEIGKLVRPIQKWNPSKVKEARAFWYIDISSVDRESKKITDPSEVLTPEAPSRARQLVKENDVLVSTVRPNLNGVAIVPHELEGATASTGYCVLRARPERLDTRYLFYWVRSRQFVADMERKATGASYPAVTDAIIKTSLIPLPPLPVQRRIAAVLDKADALRRKRGHALDKLDDLLQAVFLDMFGDPVTNPKGWPRVTVEEFAELLSGFAFTSKDYISSEYQGPKIRLCRGINVGVGNIDWSDCAYWPDTCTSEHDRYQLQENDIVLAMDRPWISTGQKIAVLGESDLPAFLVQRVMRIRPLKPIYTHFLYYSFAHPAFELRCNPTETTVPHISPNDIKRYELHRPSETMLHRFGKICESISTQQARMNQGILKADYLFNALMQKAFNGELTFAEEAIEETVQQEGGVAREVGTQVSLFS